MITSTYAIFHRNKQYDCEQHGNSVAVFNTEGKGELIGHIPNLVIPNEDEQHVGSFEVAVKAYLHYLL